MNLIKFEYNKHCYGEIQKMWVKHKTKNINRADRIYLE